MAQTGRKPKPTQIKILEGNPGKRPLNNNEPKPQPKAPPMPRGMPKEAQTFWKDTAPRLEPLGILTEVDGAAFHLLALYYCFAKQAADSIKADGLTSVDENGAPRKNPMLQIFRDNAAGYRAMCAEFGLTPSSRSRLSIPEPEDEGDFFGY